MHTLFACIRAQPALAGIPNPPQRNIRIFNDTGSEIQSLHLSDLQAIGLDPWNPQFMGYCGPQQLLFPQGRSATVPKFVIEIKILGRTRRATGITNRVDPYCCRSGCFWGAASVWSRNAASSVFRHGEEDVRGADEDVRLQDNARPLISLYLYS